MSLGDARRALAGGAPDEALVYLWNELEPARLADDRRALEAIARMAAQIATEGDPAQQRDANRLLEELAEAEAAKEALAVTVGHDGGQPPPAPPVFEPGDWTTPGEQREPGEAAPVEPGEEGGEGEPEGRPRLASLLWAAIVVAVILLNIVRDLLDRS